MKLKIRIFTEDGATTATETIEAVVKRLLYAAYPQIQTQNIEFLPPLPVHNPIVRGNKWRSDAPRDRSAIIDLFRDIATDAVQPDHFVVFHFDGDTTWAQRLRAATPTQFQTKIVDKAKQHAITMAQERGNVSPVNDEKIIRLVPHYAIEAWLFQNFDACEAASLKSEDLEQITSWRRDRSLLDEVVKPDELLRIGKSCNLPLAESLSNATVRDVVAAGKSLAAIVAGLQSNAALNAAVARISLNVAPV